MDNESKERYKQQGMEELNGALDLNKQDWQKVAVRLMAVEGAEYSLLCDEMEDRFLVRPRSGGPTEPVVTISLHPSKRELLLNTVLSAGYRVKDAHSL